MGLGGGGGGGGWGVEEWMKHICPCFSLSRIALAEGAREAVSLRGTLSTRFFFFFFFKNKRLYDIHVTRFLHRERDSAPHSNKLSFMFSQQLAKFQNETKIKTSLRARGPPGVSGALCSLRILHIGRIGSA